MTSTTDDQLEWHKEMEAMAKEKLHPELQAFLTTSSVLGRYVKHPLVFGSADVPGFLNQQLAGKKDLVARAEASRAWQSYLWLHERPWRLPKLMELVHTNRITTSELREVLLSIWGDTELPHQFRKTPLVLFRRAGFLTDAPSVWEALRAPLTVYRGDSRHPKATSISWTLARGKAEWFARRWKGIKGRPGKLWRGVIEDKRKVLAYVEARGEAEVVVSPEDLTGIREEVIASDV